MVGVGPSPITAEAHLVVGGGQILLAQPCAHTTQTHGYAPRARVILLYVGPCNFTPSMRSMRKHRAKCYPVAHPNLARVA